MATKDPWIISTVEQFAKDFPPGTALTAKELGEWMIAHEGIAAPDSKKASDPTWVKYVHDRAALRKQLNRYSSSKAFAENSMFHPFEVHHIKGDEYKVCAINDDIRKVMRDLLKKTRIGFKRKAHKLDRLQEVAKSQSYDHAEVIRLGRMKQDLDYTRVDIERTILRAEDLLNRCDQDFLTMAALGITNGNDGDEED